MIRQLGLTGPFVLVGPWALGCLGPGAVLGLSQPIEYEAFSAYWGFFGLLWPLLRACLLFGQSQLEVHARTESLLMQQPITPLRRSKVPAYEGTKTEMGRSRSTRRQMSENKSVRKVGLSMLCSTRVSSDWKEHKTK